MITSPGAPVPRRRSSVCSHVVIWRVVETGSFFGLSTGQDPRRLHPKLRACPAGVPRGVVPKVEKAGAVLASAYRKYRHISAELATSGRSYSQEQMLALTANTFNECGCRRSHRWLRQSHRLKGRMPGTGRRLQRRVACPRAASEWPPRFPGTFPRSVHRACRFRS